MGYYIEVKTAPGERVDRAEFLAALDAEPWVKAERYPGDPDERFPRHSAGTAFLFDAEFVDVPGEKDTGYSAVEMVYRLTWHCDEEQVYEFVRNLADFCRRWHLQLMCDSYENEVLSYEDAAERVSSGYTTNAQSVAEWISELKHHLPEGASIEAPDLDAWHPENEEE